MAQKKPEKKKWETSLPAARAELRAVNEKLRGAQARIEQLEAENANLRGELAPGSGEGTVYRSRLTRMKELREETATEAAIMVDKLMGARHALEIVCGAAAYQEETIGNILEAEKNAQVRLMELMRKGYDV